MKVSSAECRKKTAAAVLWADLSYTLDLGPNIMIPTNFMIERW